MRSEIETPKGDLSREATAPRGGFVYQDYLTALQWLHLGDDEILFLEVSEDFVRASDEHLLAAQVKNVSGRITLNDEGARRALASFVELTALNPSRSLTYTFLTTATATVEKELVHQAGPEGGIKYWRKVQEGSDVTPLRHALLAMSLDPAVVEFITDRSDDRLRTDLISRFHWSVGTPPGDEIKQELGRKISAELRRRGLLGAEAKRGLPHVLWRVVETAQLQDRNKRKLDKQDLDDLLDSLATRTVSVSVWDDAMFKAAKIEHLPVEEFNRLVLARLEVMKNSRRFFGYDKAAEARKLAHAVRHPGEYSSASQEIRARVLSWSARVLLDDDRQEADELIAEARELDPNAEALGMTEAIGLAETSLDGAMARIAMFDSPASMTARYLIQLRASKGEATLQGALGWFNAAALPIHAFDEDGQALILDDYLRADRWDDAIRLANEVHTTTLAHPSLLLTCGVIAVGEATPPSHRAYVVQMPPVWGALDFPLSATNEGMEARSKAIRIFEQLHEVATTLNLSIARDHAREYIFWLTLTENPKNASVLRQIEALIAQTPGWIRWIPLATSARLELDLPAIRQRLDQQFARVGSLDFHGARALLAVLQAEDPPPSTATWRKYRARVAPHFTAELLTGFEVEAHLREGDVAGARAALGGLVESPQADRIRQQFEIHVAQRGGINVLEQRREVFLQTDQTSDLMKLIECLAVDKKWSELAERTGELFRRVQTVDNAERHVHALQLSDQWENLCTFFDTYPEFSERSERLAGNYAQSRLFLGQWAELRRVIASGRLSPALAMRMEIRGALLSLQWQDLNSRIDLALASASGYSPEVLIQLASAAEVLARPSDARTLTHVAAASAPDDPRVLFSSFYQASKGSWDDEERPGEWLRSAIASTGDDGVVQSKTLAEIAELIPRWRKQNEQAWASLQTGQIWLEAWGELTNQTLAQSIVGAAIQNKTQTDVRRRSIILSFSGARAPLPLTPGGTVGLDITALLNLAQLQLLGELKHLFSAIKVSHRTGAWLYEEFGQADFHQPRRIEDARELLSHIAEDRLGICPRVASADGSLDAQVGTELGDLLRHATILQQGGADAFVIRTSPVPRVDSLLESVADLSAYAPVLRSVLCLVQSLDEHGFLTVTEKDRALAFLAKVDRRWDADAEIPLGATLMLDDLTINYLNHVGLLPTLMKARFTLKIHSEVRDQATEYRAVLWSNGQLRAVLSSIREFLAAGIQSGFVQVLPAPFSRWSTTDDSSSTMLELIEIEDSFDSVLVDDRFFNRHSVLQRRDHAAIPVHCTLDVIDQLRELGAIDDRKWRSLRTDLRCSGHALVPVTQAELSGICASPRASNRRLRESLDLRSIRESIALLQLRGVFLLPNEGPWLISYLNAIGVELNALLDVPASQEQTALGGWLLDLIDLRDFGQRVPGEMTPTRLRYLRYASHVKLIAACLSRMGEIPAVQTLEALFDPVQWADPLGQRWLIGQAKRMLIDLKGRLGSQLPAHSDPSLVPLALLQGIQALPESIRRGVLADEPLVLELQLPFMSHLKLDEIEGHPRFLRETMWDAAVHVLATGMSTDLKDLSDRTWRLRSAGKGGIALEAEGVAQPLLFPGIELSSPDEKIRLGYLASVCARTGADVDQFAGGVKQNVMLAPLTSGQVDHVHCALEHYPLPYFEKLVETLNDGAVTLQQLFPDEMDYYENLVGRWDGQPHIEAFAASQTSTTQNHSLDTGLWVELLRAGHAATAPHATVQHADYASLVAFIRQWVPQLDLWSLTVLLECLFSRPNVVEELGVELVLLLERFHTLIEQTPQRRELSVALIKASDVRVRSITTDPALPPYWRRLAAIAHAALVERAILASGFPQELFIERLNFLVVSYVPASLVDMQREPRWAPFLMNERQIQQELLGRVLNARIAEADSSTREAPCWDQIESIVHRLHAAVSGIESFPGPAEGVALEQPLSSDHETELLRQFDVVEQSKLISLWKVAGLIGVGGTFSDEVRLKLLNSLRGVSAGIFASYDPHKSVEVLVWLAYCAASNRDVDLATSVISLARAVAAASESGTPAAECLYISMIAAAAHADRGTWSDASLECAMHAAHTCVDRDDAISALATIESFTIADSELELRFADARVALKSTALRA